MLDIKEYFIEMKKIQTNLVAFIDDEDNSEENFDNLHHIFEEIKISDDRHMLKSLLHLILNISMNHHRFPNFFNKIERILQLFKDSIKKFYSKSEIFHIFQKSKRILLLLIEQQIMIFDDYFVKQITAKKYVDAKYPQYFAPEIQLFKKNNTNFGPIPEIEELEAEIPENFYELRKEGENDSYICKLIREDSVVEFITYVNKHNYPLDSSIASSIYETNPYLYLHNNFFNKLDLIKYAAFFGSIQILQYLKMNNVKLTHHLWLYAIHSHNPELIHYLEQEDVKPNNEKNKHEVSEKLFFQRCLNESINCHHNDIAIYIKDNILINNENPNSTFREALRSHNFAFLPIEFTDGGIIISFKL